MQLNARFDEKGGRRTRNKKFLLTISLFCFSSVSFQIIKKKRFGATEPRRKNTLGGGGGKNFFKEIFSRTKNVSNQIDWLFWRIFHRAHTSPISDTIAIGKTAAIRGRAFSIPIHTPRTDDLKITMKKPINGAPVKRVRATVTEKGPAAMGGAPPTDVSARPTVGTVRPTSFVRRRNDFRGTRGIVTRKKPVKNPRKTADRDARARNRVPRTRRQNVVVQFARAVEFRLRPSVFVFTDDDDDDVTLYTYVRWYLRLCVYFSSTVGRRPFRKFSREDAGGGKKRGPVQTRRPAVPRLSRPTDRDVYTRGPSRRTRFRSQCPFRLVRPRY